MTVIVGAGPAGLAGGFWRAQQQPDAPLTVLEAADRPGGWVRSDVVDGYLCERGPQAIRPTPQLAALIAALGAEDARVEASPASKSRWIGRGGALIPTPGGPGGLVSSPLLSLRGQARLLKEPVVAQGGRPGESVSEFMARRFGPEVVPVVQAMVSGVFAGDADRLEIASAFPLLAGAEKAGGSVLRGIGKARRAQAEGDPPPDTEGGHGRALMSFEGGVEGLVRILAAALGDSLQAGNGATELSREEGRWRVGTARGSILCDEVVLACPSGPASKLVAGIDAELSRELAAVPTASLASVYLGFSARDLPATLQGFGFLLEPGEATPVLGGLYCSSLFPSHAPDGQALVRVMMGGVRNPGTVDLSDAQLIDLATDALRRYGGLKVPVDFAHITRVRNAIPQYERGHAARLERIAERLRHHDGLTLRGNSYRAIAFGKQLGVKDAVA